MPLEDTNQEDTAQEPKPSAAASAFMASIGRLPKEEENQPDQNDPDPSKKAEDQADPEKKSGNNIIDQIDDDPFPLKTPQEKPKKTKEDNITALRQKKDEAEKKLTGFTTLFGEVDPSAIAPVYEYLKETVKGPITPDAVLEIVGSIKSKDEEITALRTELDERENVVKNLDVRHSKEFQKEFEIPYKNATDTLFAEYAMIHDKKVLGPKSTQALHDFLTKSENLTAIEVKEALIQFGKSYKQETGEDAVLPTQASMMTSLREFYSKRDGLHHAFENWQEVKKKTQEKTQIETQKQQEERVKAHANMRREYATKAYNDFNLEDAPAIEPRVLQKHFKEEYELGEKLASGKDVPEWDTLIVRGVKSRLYDEILPRYKELLELEERVKKGDRNGLDGHDSPPKTGEQGPKFSDFLKTGKITA